MQTAMSPIPMGPAYDRRHNAMAAIANPNLNPETLARVVDVLRGTLAQSADDNRDDLCLVHVRGPLTWEQVELVAGTPIREDVRFAYGSSVETRNSWVHRWTRRRKGSGVLSREEWLTENARIILGSGTELKVFGGEWIRFGADLDYYRLAMEAAEAHDARRAS